MHTDLWDKIRFGDTSAMKTLYQACYQQLYVYGFKLIADKEKTKDSIHELFCELWEKRSSLQSVNHVPAYLKICLRNKLLKQIKQDTLIGSINDIPEVETLKELSYEDLLIAAQQDAASQYKLKMAINQLTPTQKEIIKLKFFEGLNYESIAQNLQLKHRTVYNHVHTAISQLRDFFSL
ncbi:RNA polymerase sigma factor [Pedobacter ureilyticus]|jgi:RNA polymerase sigma-70 factor (ECF subfamily)|uniref:RNA polymerase sigma factor n=1 Tax=Pedobacter ureilyticus TaxID=1393051 RepID=A0ABW9J487_9SPHI|nr:sigma-70 family RNA polymerase sigma factor [Pedobacter helvus]